MKSYIINRILNNNVVVALDEFDNEVIVMGKGIGFQKSKGDEIESCKIEKKFVNNDEAMYKRLYSTLKKTPIEYLEVVQETIKEVHRKIGRKLNDEIYILLTDHISFAIERTKNNVVLSCPMMFEIKMLYKEEYKIGLNIVDFINQKLHIQLPESEAAFIALHIMNASTQKANINDTLDVMIIIKDIIDIIENFYKMKFDVDSVDYLRLMTHLNFFAKRVIMKKEIENDDDIARMFYGKFKKAEECVGVITEYMQKQFKYNISEQEKLYLAIHIKKNTGWDCD